MREFIKTLVAAGFSLRSKGPKKLKNISPKCATLKVAATIHAFFGLIINHKRFKIVKQGKGINGSGDWGQPGLSAWMLGLFL
ncbi:MAG: hypothetical protein QME78_17480, partial [Thermodesulfobacteriota bacterium]|nr:hypothetical protein [Thermodesulfobacteriota bacterium]